MKMEIHRVERQSIESFASMHQLTLQVHERTPDGLPRWFCYFNDIEIKDGSVLLSGSGKGNTIEEAVKDYCNNLSRKLVVYKATDKEKRKEFRMPLLTPEYEGEKQ